MKTFFKEFIKDECGQDMVEYSLLLAAAAVIVTASVVTLTSTMSAKFTAINLLVNPS